MSDGPFSRVKLEVWREMIRSVDLRCGSGPVEALTGRHNIPPNHHGMILVHDIVAMHYIPAQKIRPAAEHRDFRSWSQEGYITPESTTPGASQHVLTEFIVFALTLIESKDLLKVLSTARVNSNLD